MDQVKRSSLKRKLLPYVIVMIVFAFIGAVAIGYSANVIEEYFLSNYATFVTKNDENAQDMGLTGVWVGEYEWANKKYEIFYNFANQGQALFMVLWGLLCVAIIGNIFYKKHIKEPLSLLMNGVNNISENNLDFTIESKSNDEIGLLALAFEKMRLSLKEINSEMWRQFEERKRLNAAFSHDLRTPLTVLKGQSEMLQKYVPKMSDEKIVATAQMMERHIARLEAYVNTMNSLQRLEDIEISKSSVCMRDIMEQMQLTGESLCADKRFSLREVTAAQEGVLIDLSVVMQVYENLLSNAVRFAKEGIVVTAKTDSDYFTITVHDDGAGFTAEALANASRPFYKAESETDNEHFGIGLNICNILCEKHGGYLKISNDTGAFVTAVFRQ